MGAWEGGGDQWGTPDTCMGGEGEEGGRERRMKDHIGALAHIQWDKGPYTMAYIQHFRNVRRYCTTPTPSH